MTPDRHGDDTDTRVRAFFAELRRQSHDDTEAIERLYVALRDHVVRGQSLLAARTVHRYMCRRGCQIATVFRASGMTLCAVRDYKYSPGLNENRSVESARAKNTLDGERHWPAHVYDIAELAEWGDQAGIDMVCRHVHVTILARDILSTVEGVQPGKPNKPTRL